MLGRRCEGSGKEDDEVKVADLAIHLLDAIEAGEQQMGTPTPRSTFTRDSLRVPGFAGQGSTATVEATDAPEAVDTRSRCRRAASRLNVGSCV